MEFFHNVGLVGSKLIFSTGKLQEAGGVVFCDGSAMNYGREDNPDSPEYNYLKDFDYYSGASICVRKEIWKELEGFDQQFAPAYYENTDLFFRIIALVYRTVLQPKSMAIHVEGTTHGTDLSTGIKRKQVDNQVIFLNKWKPELEKNNFHRDENLYLARDKSKHCKVILVIDHMVPCNADNERLSELFSFVNNERYRVKILSANFIANEFDIIRWEFDGVEVLYNNWYKENWKNRLVNNVPNLEKIYFIDVKNAEFWLPQLRSIMGESMPNIVIGN